MSKVLANQGGKILVANNKAFIKPQVDLEDLTITPTTSQQIFTHPTTDGYDEVTVNAVTSAIDSNIQAENIKKDVTILGVTGTHEGGENKLNTLLRKQNITLTAEDFDGVTSIDQYSGFRANSHVDVSSWGNSITSIGASAFNGCSRLSCTSLPEGLTVINSASFDQCSSLALTSLPPNITSIGSQAFRGCNSLAISHIPNSVTRIDGVAFGIANGMRSLTFDGTPTTIATNAFYNCNNLLEINVPWAEGAVAGAPWGASKAQVNYEVEV